MNLTEKDRKRFEEKFRVTPGCWIWEAFKNPHGYGYFNVKGKIEKAHRVSYELYVGPIPEGLFGCHRCDNPSCVNPEHVFPGTNQDNMDDMDAKNRRHIHRGAAHGMAKLTDLQVMEIRTMPGRQRDIAKHFGVSQAMINNIKLGKNWKHLKDERSEP